MRECVQRVLALLKECDLSDESRVRQGLRSWGEEKFKRMVEECRGKLEELYKDPCLSSLPPWKQGEYREMIQRSLEATRVRLEGEPEVEFALGVEEAVEGEEVHAIVSVRNPRITPVKCRVSFAGDFEVAGAPREVEVPPLGEEAFEVVVKPKGVGPRDLTVRVEVAGEAVKTVRKARLHVRPLEPKLEVEVSAPAQEVGEGEEVPLKILLRNVGTATLHVECPQGCEPGSLTLGRGEVCEVEFRVRVPSDGVVRVPEIRYSAGGGTYRVSPGEVRLKVKRVKKGAVEPEIEAPAREVGHEEPVQPGISLEDVLQQAAAHGLAALIGKWLGERFPERREFPKPVYVEDLPHYVKEDVTIILEDPAAVVEEDRGSYVLVRRAKPAELEHVVTVDAARLLVENFKLAVDSAVRSWSPFPDAKVSRKEVRASEKELKAISKKVEELRAKLPENFYVEYTFSRGSLGGRTLLKVYAGAYSRLRRLHERGRDDEPASLGEAFKGLELPTPSGEHSVVYVFASPTGWDGASILQARSISGPALYVLVNLKTGEAYYNAGEQLAARLAEELQRLLGHGGPPVYSEEVLKYDRMLLRGEISEEFYRRKLEELLRAR